MSLFENLCNHLLVYIKHKFQLLNEKLKLYLRITILKVARIVGFDSFRSFLVTLVECQRFKNFTKHPTFQNLEIFEIFKTQDFFEAFNHLLEDLECPK